MYGWGSASCYIATKILSFFFSAELYQVSQYFSYTLRFIAVYIATEQKIYILANKVNT